MKRYYWRGGVYQFADDKVPSGATPVKKNGSRPTKKELLEQAEDLTNPELYDAIEKAKSKDNKARKAGNKSRKAKKKD